VLFRSTTIHLIRTKLTRILQTEMQWIRTLQTEMHLTEMRLTKMHLTEILIAKMLPMQAAKTANTKHYSGRKACGGFTRLFP